MVTLESVATWRTVSTFEKEISAVREIVVMIPVVETENPLTMKVLP